MKKIILISGVSSGLGFSFAKDLALDGHEVYGFARDLDKMQPLKKMGVNICKLDICDYSNVNKYVAEIIKKHGKIDVLINNAGFGLFAAFEDCSIDEAKYQLDVNLFALANLTKTIIPFMRENKQGRIINISSSLGKAFMPLASWYIASKHALEGLSDSLRTELRNFNIDVVIVEPGAINTNFSNIMFEGLNKRSKNGAYGHFVKNLSKLKNEKNKKYAGNVNNASKIITKIVNANKVKRRYVIGKDARLMIFARRFLGDGIYERSLNVIFDDR